MLSEPRKKLFAAITAASLAGVPLALADSFTANLTTVTPGQTLELSYQADQALAQDIYLAAQFNGALLFVDGQGGVVPYQAGVPTPARLAAPGAGSHRLFSFTMPEGFYTSLTFYQVAGRPGSDLLAPGNFDAATLRTVAVAFTAKSQGADSGDGGKLYAAACASCHSPAPGDNIAGIQAGVNPEKTLTAIQKNAGGMKYLSYLSNDEIAAIAKWIANPV